MTQRQTCSTPFKIKVHSNRKYCWSCCRTRDAEREAEYRRRRLETALHAQHSPSDVNEGVNT